MPPGYFYTYFTQILFLLAVTPFLITELSHTEAIKTTVSWGFCHPLSSAASPSGKVKSRTGRAVNCILQVWGRSIACFQVTFQADVHELSIGVTVCVCVQITQILSEGFQGTYAKHFRSQTSRKIPKLRCPKQHIANFFSGFRLMTLCFPLSVSRLQLGK